MRSCLVAAGVMTLMVVLCAVPSAQGVVISFEHASRLKKAYPFLRFSALSSFELPALDFFGLERSPDAAASTRRGALDIPPSILALHGKPASIRGFMLPIDVNASGVSRFILTSSIDSCHWGMVGQAHEWVLVEIAGGQRVPFLKFQPVTVFGKLSVEPQWRGTQLSSLYQLRAEFFAGDGL
jgi:hypothetical protein